MAEVLFAICMVYMHYNWGLPIQGDYKLQKQFTTPKDAAEYLHRLENPQPQEPSPLQSDTQFSEISHPLTTQLPTHTPWQDSLLFSHQKLSRCKLHPTLQPHSIQYAFPFTLL